MDVVAIVQDVFLFGPEAIVSQNTDLDFHLSTVETLTNRTHDLMYQ